MPRKNPRVCCKRCGRHRDEAGHISARGLCADCGIGAMERNAVELATMRGESVARWRRGVAASVGAMLVDDA